MFTLPPNDDAPRTIIVVVIDSLSHYVGGNAHPVAPIAPPEQVRWSEYARHDSLRLWPPTRVFGELHQRTAARPLPVLRAQCRGPNEAQRHLAALKQAHGLWLQRARVAPA